MKQQKREQQTALASTSSASTTKLMAPVTLSPQEIIIAFTRAMNKSMKITSGKDAMALLLGSTRISEDLGKQLQFANDNKSLFNQSIIIREWIDEVSDHPECEYRCFVHNKQFNAVTQYFSDVCFPELTDQVKKV